MNKETVCAIVRDLMPSHIEAMTEPETAAFVEQHLAECESCRKVKRNMLSVTLPEERAQAEYLEALRRARIRRRRRILFCIAVCFLIAAICLLPLPRRVDISVQAVRWRAGNEEGGSDAAPITMRGVYLDYLLRTDLFSGDIEIEGIEVTHKPASLLSVRMDEPGALCYKDADGKLQIVGFIAASPGMQEFMIGLHEQFVTGENDKSEDRNGWSGDGGTVLTWPALNREDAVETTRRILIEQNYTWLSEGKWEAGISGE